MEDNERQIARLHERMSPAAIELAKQQAADQAQALGMGYAQADAEVERLRNALRGLLNAQTSRERAYAAIEAHAALSEERPQVSDARLLVRSEAKETPHA